MPFGPEPLGFVYFAAVKFAGYTGAGSFLNRRYPESPRPIWLVGAARTVIGIAGGLTAVFAANYLAIPKPGLGFYVLLAPIRMCEWLLLLWLFFGRPAWHWRRALGLSALGAALSYVLDLPAVYAVFTLPGGAWIC